MTIGPREVMRSEVEGGLSGPANPIPEESLDCGCKLVPCPKLAKFATRRLFVGLLCWVGIVQAAAQAYLYISSPTIARRFLCDPNLLEWVLIVAELTPFFLGLPIAYWGDRIHRAAWTGALVLLQSTAFIILIIPNFNQKIKIIEETENFTHSSMYADDNPELCSFASARLNIDEDQPCYVTMVILVIAQILTGIANIAYYTLGISYLDDNTRKRQIASVIGVTVAVKMMGLLLGSVLAWACLKLDSKDLSPVISYRKEVGAWWLGWIVLAFLLAIPGMIISWLPRRLPSEVVEQAAASILDLAGRTSPQSVEPPESRKVGGTGFLSSLLRLFTNKILICNVLAAIFACTALVNFLAIENIFLESRYHVPRPTGSLLGFGDLLSSRVIANVLKPIIVGAVVIISGIVISKTRPKASSIVIYNVVAFIVTATILFALAFATCEKPTTVVGERKGSLLRYCNRNCRCSNEADFRPVCDSENSFTFYSPCHAGCTSIESTGISKLYWGCSCVESTTRKTGNLRAREGPCGSDSCQIGWLLFHIATVIAYSLAASTIVGSFLIVLRSVYPQDKALAIGFWMSFVSLFVYLPGKLAYKGIAEIFCEHWGRGSICHFYDKDRLGDYICYLTSVLLLLAAAFYLVLWYVSRELRLFGISISELPRESELREVERHQAVPLLDENIPGSSNDPQEGSAPKIEEVIVKTPVLDLRQRKVEESAEQQHTGQLKYGPLGLGDRRTNSRVVDTDDDLEDSSSSDEDGGSGAKGNKRLGSSPQVAYRPLELDSDVESDLSSVGPRSRLRVPSGTLNELPKDFPNKLSSSIHKRPFPNPDHYENRDRNVQDGFTRTGSFEFSKTSKPTSQNSNKGQGDFNEIGIPVMEPLVVASILTGSSPGQAQSAQQEVQVLLPKAQKQASQERLGTIRSLLESVDESRRHHLENDPRRIPETDEDVPPATITGRPPSRDQGSSGFGSLHDVRDKNESIVLARNKSPTVSRTSSPGETKPRGSPVSTAL